MGSAWKIATSSGGELPRNCKWLSFTPEWSSHWAHFPSEKLGRNPLEWATFWILLVENGINILLKPSFLRPSLDHHFLTQLPPHPPRLIWGAIEAQPATSFAALGAGGVWHWNHGNSEIYAGNQRLGLGPWILFVPSKDSLSFPLHFCSYCVNQYFKVLSVTSLRLWSCRAELPLSSAIRIATILWEIYPHEHIGVSWNRGTPQIIHL